MEVYNFELNVMISKLTIYELIVFWIWFNSDVIVMVIENFIYYWDLGKGRNNLIKDIYRKSVNVVFVCIFLFLFIFKSR